MPKSTPNPAPRITLDQLRSFLAVAELQHQRRAAEGLHLSPAAVSEQVRLLERALGVPLFERRGRGLRLTDPGRTLQAPAAAVLEAARAVEETAAAHRGLEQGRLTVSTGQAMGTHRVAEWLTGFCDRHPHIEVIVRLDNLPGSLAALDSGAADCAVVGGDPGRSDLEVIALERQQMVLAVSSHHALARSRTQVRELARHRYLMRTDGSATERLARQVLGPAYGTGPVLQLGLGSVLVGLLAGSGYAVVPRFQVAPWIADGRVVELPVPGPAVYQTFYAARRPGPHPPAVDSLWAHLTGIAAGASEAVARKS